MVPNWQEPAQRIHGNLSSWLLDPGSLTAKLKGLSQSFHVELLFQREQACQPHEMDFLDINPNTPTLVREVLLHCDQTPWVYARSVIPLTALSAADQTLAKMGTNPLGEQLFTRAGIQPGRIQVASFGPQTRPGQLNTRYFQTKETLWGRRRLFHLQQGAISVAEVFLSPSPCYAKGST